MTRILAVTVAVLIAGWNTADALTPSGVLLAAATALAVAGLILLATRHPAPPAALHGPARPAASRDHHTIFVRHRDPSAPGHPRPRAPSPRGGAARG